LHRNGVCFFFEISETNANESRLKCSPDSARLIRLVEVRP